MIQPELKIIADHLRSSCFLISDGVLPSNEGRGYVLRRIMRRGMRQLHKLGAREASMYKLVDALIKEMGTAYPELSRARAVITNTLKTEEEKFRETLEKGLKILEEEITHITTKHEARSTKHEAQLSGSIAFKLYDTYGFPLDLTQDILKEKNIEVDTEEFNHEMELQRERAKANWKGSGEVAEEKIFFDLKEKFGETKFLGYETLSTKAKILAVLENGIILNQTPFYATSGGQKGDDGKIGNVEISETKKFAGGVFFHFFFNQKCDLKVGDEVLAEVNSITRAMRAANHSATHLMHKALKEILGNSISQRGSNVDAEYFTFDFNFNRAMTAEEIKKVEDLVNKNIKAENPVNTNIMALDKAQSSGAEALFGEKYDAEVRVVSMGNSVELCGGTHVKNTSEIGIFKIISEKSIASGIRRIEAKTADAAKKYLAEEEKKLQNLIQNYHKKIAQKNQEILQLGGKESENINRDEKNLNKLEQELKRRDKEIEQLKKQNLFKNLTNLKSEKIGAINLLAHIFDDAEAKDIRDIVAKIKTDSEFSTLHIIAFFACKDEKVSVCVAVTNDLQEKFDATKLIAPIIETIGGKGGGGKKDFAMGGGTMKDNILQAIEVLKNQI
ncbi:MAG: alanine--tRNA ligase [Alphaproteobacteria bacterium RIFCSPLOWO2_01_FULL_40_26]|nr:MAG: alanine--tRNA ligase [Alphaproteobacteria bacterium RIFCSPHIGHO2_02_FULL_40_34]OFW85732.1 MAG: alanine--tRNA ligase [Alphaproteobacteria bacterium RIFCSPHIGHO2_01_FULL_40_8]OFW94171.1 MAG: alanine--tRNA ligase [Alphaproteobacteria bacterium RIFCSPLOWO2_01_FULL_40_26]OFX09740.1 MAG: alanine--tRNA ligase [Alphaproteobacteria bacterium RIFCSPLOWO2_02_FULL_40_19]OFX11448.1 MAG: alanine--tRNA ligase [Alphaproteobacteria bacterium RIFCSPLOWO2_12_FULL_40_11]